ncbi:MAG: hypothetical protein GX921_00110 [Bacteroidales bacterium]|nr:hypothetical protein [Bacteroidales bacterium]
MTTRAITFFILFSLLFAAYGQTNNEEGKEPTELQKKIEAYIIDTFHCTYHNSIEFHEKKPFNLNQLIADHKTPEILKDDPRAIIDNKEAFDWLEEVSSEYVIPYSMTYVFGTKDEELDEWNPMWVLLLLDDELEIIGHIRYFP